MKTNVLVLAAFLIAVAVHTGSAAERVLKRPNAGGEPTTINIEVFVIDVDEINSADQTFTANIYFEIRWQDPRLADPGGDTRRFKPDELWHPSILVVNRQKLWPSLPNVFRVDPDGTVTHRQQLWGDLSQPLDLREFPFDQQEFTVLFASPDCGPDEIRLEAGRADESGIADDLSLPDWVVTSWKAEPATYQPVEGVPPVVGFAFRFTADRASDYYVIKVMVPLILILVMAGTVFWINPKESGTQIGISTTAMLTLIVYRFAIGSDLPKIPYLTRMDIFILACTILVVICLIEVVITSRLMLSGRATAALRIDQVMRVLFPLTVALVAAYAFYVF